MLDELGLDRGPCIDATNYVTENIHNCASSFFCGKINKKLPNSKCINVSFFWSETQATLYSLTIISWILLYNGRAALEGNAGKVE